MQASLLQPWSPDSAARSGPPHTWIRSWTSDVDVLRADVTAAGWQWHSIQHIDHDADVLAAVFDVFMQRERRQWAPVERGMGQQVPRR